MDKMQQAADALVEDLFSDLDDRSGFDTGGVDPVDVAEWKAKWAALIVAAMQKVQEPAPRS
jgi:hypothetical protein